MSKNTNIFSSSPQQERSQSQIQPPCQSKVIDIFHSAPQTNMNIIRRQQLLCIVCRERNSCGKIAECEHSVICLKCAGNIIQYSVKQNKVPRCSIQACKKSYIRSKDNFIFKKIDQKVQLQWTAFQLKQYLPKNITIFKCQKPDCPGFIDPKDNQCQICKQKHCQNCHRVYHDDSCIGVSINLQNAENIKKCKYCKKHISKQGGCNKITCQNCLKIICYQCLNEWSLSHHGCGDILGWIKLPYYYVTQLCCSDTNISRQFSFQQ